MEVSCEKLLLQQDFIQKIRQENEQMQGRLYAFAETYGCAQNENDSERIRGMLIDMGYEITENSEKADLIIYNTCAVRENAEVKVFGKLGALKRRKAENPSLIVGVCGCMMQQAHIAEDVRKKYRHVDMVFGTHALYKFPEILDRARRGARVFSTENSDGEIAEGISISRDSGIVARISVMYGCNNFCSYCIVPYVRGRERSRSAENILTEVREAAKQGYKEVTLLGQNVNSYGKDLGEDGLSFAQLLREVCRVDGIERIRFLTSHPKDISDELIEVMATEPKLCKHLHLPVQSGSDAVLGKMNRRYTRDAYLDIVRRVREKMPDIALTTDIIVGFPTETAADVELTIALLEAVEFDMVYSFIYSKRRGTPAAEMKNEMSEEDKHKSFDRICEVQNEISRRKNEAMVGRCERVLVESVSRTNEDFLSGRTEGGKIVNFRGDKGLIGRFVNVKITECKTWSLTGEIV